jgi:hypothetical protein
MIATLLRAVAAVLMQYFFNYSAFFTEGSLDYYTATDTEN